MHIEQIEIRPARIEDASSIASLSGQLGYQASGVEIQKRLTKIVQSADHGVFVASRTKGEILGWIHVFSTLRIESNCFCEIGGLVIDEGYRKKGVGAKLVYAAQEWTTLKGIRLLRVRSRIEREGAKKFYMNVGFSLIKEQHIFEKEIFSIK